MYIYIYIYIYICRERERERESPSRLFRRVDRTLRSVLVVSIRKKRQVEGLKSHIQIHRIMCQIIVNRIVFAGNVCMREFKAPGSGN